MIINKEFSVWLWHKYHNFTSTDVYLNKNPHTSMRAHDIMFISGILYIMRTIEYGLGLFAMQ